MRRSLSDLQPVEVPEGVQVRSFRPGDEQPLLEVNAHAFAHHPEQGHMTLEDLRERTSEAWFDPDGLFLAVPSDPGPDDPPLLGFHWTKEHRDEDPPYGEVYVVAVNPKAAGRGLGTVLTGVGLQHLKDRGLRVGAALRRRRQRPGDRRLHRPGLRGANAPRCSTAAPRRVCTADGGLNQRTWAVRSARQASAARSRAAISALYAGASRPTPTMLKKPWTIDGYRFSSTSMPFSASSRA